MRFKKNGEVYRGNSGNATIALGCLALLVMCSIPIGALYVIIHFIIKWW